MRFAYTNGQQALRDDLRQYFAQLLDDQTRSELARDPYGSSMRRVVRKLGRDGWLGIGRSIEDGGRGGGLVEQYIFYDEVLRAGIPFPAVAVNMVAPTLIEHGTEQQRSSLLPAIFGGEVFFCLGLSEPEAGTDLASLRTAAVRDGADYVVRGSKTWTSFYSCADYCFLAVRTDSLADHHKGLSVLVLPMDTPGITIAPLHLLNDHDIATIYLDNARIPVSNRIGAENDGWSILMTLLNHERTTLGASGAITRLYEDVVQWAGSEVFNGRLLIETGWVRQNIARAYSTLEAIKLMSWSNVHDTAFGRRNVANVSAAKVASTEGFLDVLGWLMEIMGECCCVAADSTGTTLKDRASFLYRFQLAMTFGGGANEIQRDIVARRGLHFPPG